MATVTAIYRPFLVAVGNTAIGTHLGVRLYECLTKPLLQNFPTCTCTVRLIGQIRYHQNSQEISGATGMNGLSWKPWANVSFALSH